MIIHTSKKLTSDEQSVINTQETKTIRYKCIKKNKMNESKYTDKLKKREKLSKIQR